MHILIICFKKQYRVGPFPETPKWLEANCALPWKTKVQGMSFIPWCTLGVSLRAWSEPAYHPPPLEDPGEGPF